MSNCPSGHPLSLRTTGAFSCDVCSEHSKPSEGAMRCASCDYDKCIVCFARDASVACPQGHTLTKTVVPNDGYTCDKCEAKVAKDAVVASCRSCDYDVCAKCVFNSTVELKLEGATESEEFDTLWQKVETLDRKLLPKSSLELVREIIVPKARKINDHAQLLKASIFLAKGTILTEDVGMDVGMKLLEQELITPTFVTTPTDISFLHSMMGELYTRYLGLVQHSISSRTDPGEDTPLPDDIKVWANAQLERVSFDHYVKSLDAADELARENAQPYNPVLANSFNPTSFAGRVRPSLLDFLGHRALTYFANESNYITEPSNRFILKDKNAFSDAKDFVAINFETPDTTSRKFRALQIYQKMLKAKLAVIATVEPKKRDDSVLSFVELDLLRVQFVRNSLKGFSEKELRTMHFTYLNNLLAYCDSYPGAKASVLVAIGKQYREAPVAKTMPLDGAPPPEEEEEKKDLPTAIKYFELALKACNSEQNPEALSAAESQIDDITSPSLAVTTEKVMAINTPILVHTKSKCIDSLAYCFYEVSDKAYQKYNDLSSWGDERRTYLLTCPLVSKQPFFNVSLQRPKDDNYFRTVEFVAEGIQKSGRYVLATWDASKSAKDSEKFIVAFFNISNIAFIRTQVERQETYVVTHRMTGEPLSGVKAAFYKRMWVDNSYTRKHLVTLKSDANGFINPTEIPDTKKEHYYGGLEITFTLGDDTLDVGDHHYSRDRDYNPSSRHQTLLFTDRNMYRPSQTVYFKGIHVLVEPVGCPKIQKGAHLAISFYDANHQQKDTVSVTTNEYGSFEGTFTTPSDGLTGMMSIKCHQYGTATFRVEEYKRPRFEVTLKAPAQTIKVGGKAKITGKAMNFSGIPLSGATVKYRVRRTARVPWFWAFWCRSPRWGGKSAEIMNDIATVGENGEFEVVFDAVPDLDVPVIDKPEFDYEVTADVTDITGETQFGQATMKVGYMALSVNVPLSDTMDVNALKKVNVSLTDLNSNPIAAQAEVTLEPLVTPYPWGCPYIARYWKVPDSIALDKPTFKKLLPQFAYIDEASADKWTRVGAKFSRTVKSTGESASIQTDLNQGSLLPNTYYRVTISARDSFGTPLTVSRTVCLYDQSSPESVSATSAQTPSLHFSKPTYRVKDLAVVRYGKRIRFDRKPQPVLISIGTASQPGAFEWDRKSSTSNTLLVQERAVSVAEEDRGSVTAVCAFVAYNRVFVATKTAAVPWIEKGLTFEYLSFRDKLEPGQQEQWRIKVKSTDPQAPNQAIAAEVVAALYDASLDKLKGNGEHTFNKGMGIFPSRSAQLSASSGTGFFASNGNELHATRSRVLKHQYYYGSHCYLDWFSFPFRHERPQIMLRRGGGGRKARRDMADECYEESEVMMDCMAAEEECEDRCEKRMAAPKMKKMAAKNEQAKEKCADNDEGEGGEEPASSDDDADNQEKTEATEVTVRTNLKETVFFMPNLRTEADGSVSINFTMGESLTRWRLLAFAHTEDLKMGSHSDASIITQKELMVTPNPPRFLREGDSISFTTKISNMTDTLKDGTVTLEILDGISGQPINAAFALSPSASIPFRVDGNGQSVAVSWPVKVPYGSPNVVTWRIIARSGKSGDGEESALPVVTNRMLVTDTLPMSVRGGQQKTFTLKSLSNNTSSTLSHEAYTVEFTSNPAWYAVQALPYMMEFPHECSEQLFTRYYSNSLATHITKMQPQIQKVFETWRALGSDALKSNLSKNEELKSALLHETPWVLEAQSEEHQKKQIALLFDLNRMASESTRAVDKLRGRQMSDGGFSWFPGGQASLYITQHIAMGLAHLAHLGVKDIAFDIQVAAQDHCYRDVAREYDALLRRVSEGRAKLEDQHISHSILLFLYTESFALLHPQFKTRASRRADVMDYYHGQAATYWTSFNLYSQGLITLIHHRIKTHPNIPTDIVKSLRERSLSNEEMGTFWKQNPGYFFYEAPIETHSLMVEVFREVAADPAFVDELRLWLLKNKQTKHWQTTKQTSEAVYALLLGGESWLESTQLVSVTVGDKPLPMINPEPGTGYVKHRYPKDEVRNEMGTITVNNPNKVVAWGAAYWQYFESLDKIQWFQETPLKIKKEVKLVKLTERGEVLHSLGENNSLSVGDKVRIRIEIRVDREMDYVHLKDMRASGMEPINVLSSYKWQDGLGYYESTKDLASHFFIDHLPKGTFVFEYTLVASQKGDFSNGITTMQCMYAPEFTSHSEGIRLQIA